MRNRLEASSRYVRATHALVVLLAVVGASTWTPRSSGCAVGRAAAISL